MAGRDFATGTLPVYSHTEDVQALTIEQVLQVAVHSPESDDSMSGLAAQGFYASNKLASIWDFCS